MGKINETWVEDWNKAINPEEDNEITITRKWAMPNKRTFKIKPIKELLEKYFIKHLPIIDPFPFNYKKDATEMLNKVNDDSHYFAVFDPPYSPRQLKECYKGKGEYDTKSSTWKNWKDLLAKKIKVGGIVISFGWSSQGLGKKRGFEIIEILLVCHGGMHNDTLCVVERKILSNSSPPVRTQSQSDCPKEDLI